ncbi:hypothetical protein PGT21_027513 [Puccinia graminis f. sp. tritici]|uniref:Uncharacterized protein n=1 Tax=Puccinia graminis f. sp. tritici TaxID=56615 RepID=A0A5B0NET3_PUCGR|nr:hypothetical protein PGT21_027513 [Puccinia graminis f. sp. tritici]
MLPSFSPPITDPHQRVLIGAETNVGRRDTDVSNEPDRLGYEIVESTMKKSRFVEPPSKSALTEHLQSRSRWFHGSAEFRRFHNPARTRNGPDNRQAVL